MSDLPERAMRALASLLTDKTAFVALVTLNDEGDLELVHMSDLGFTTKEIAKMLRASAKMATDPSCEVEHEQGTVM